MTLSTLASRIKRLDATRLFQEVGLTHCFLQTWQRLLNKLVYETGTLHAKVGTLVYLVSRPGRKCSTYH